jgi:hypothetical protein
MIAQAVRRLLHRRCHRLAEKKQSQRKPECAGLDRRRRVKRQGPVGIGDEVDGGHDKLRARRSDAGGEPGK